MNENEKMANVVALSFAELEIRERYDKAEEAGDDEAAEAAVEADKRIGEIYAESDNRFQSMYNLCLAMFKRGNDLIDFGELHQYSDVPEMIGMLREYGVERFTFSSGWSYAVNAAWEFVKNGCELIGITEINGETKAFRSKEYKKVPSYIFEIK